jgi:hypothetical protein
MEFESFYGNFILKLSQQIAPVRHLVVRINHKPGKDCFFPLDAEPFPKRLYTRLKYYSAFGR